MAWDNLKAAIAAVIKNNGNNEITGDILQAALFSIINVIGENSTFKGIATPATIPDADEGSYFYITNTIGSYINFGFTIDSPGLYIIEYNGGNWELQSLPNDFFKNQAFTNNSNTVAEQVFDAEPIEMGTDLLAGSTFSDGYIDYQGKLIDNVSYEHSGFIDIENNNLLYIYLITFSGCFYDSSQKYLIGIGNVYSNMIDKNAIIAVPRGAKYIRLNRAKSNPSAYFLKIVTKTKLKADNLFSNSVFQSYLNNLNKAVKSMVINSVLLPDIQNAFLSNGINIIKNINSAITDFIPVDIDKNYFTILADDFSVTPCFGFDENYNLVADGVEIKIINQNIYALIFKNEVKFAKFNIVAGYPNYLFEGTYYPNITNKSTDKSFYQAVIPIEKSLTFGVDTQGGYINEDGSIIPSSAIQVTDFIKIIPNKILAINVSGGLWLVGCFFDKSKAFIKGINVFAVELNNNEAKFLIPENAEYVRLNILNTHGCFANYDSIFLNRKITSVNAIEGINVIESLNLAENLTYKRGYYLDNLGNEIPFNKFKYGLEFIEVEPSTIYTKYPNAEVGGIWYDENVNPIGVLSSEEYYKEDQFISPANAAFVRLAFQSEFSGLFYKGTNKRKILIPDLQLLSESYWTNKRIVWYGTSIPAGYPFENDKENYAYPNKIAAMLGANILNYCVPNGVIRSAKADGSSMGGRDNLSFTNLSSAINYQNSMLDLLGTSNEPDLFVFDYGVNDMDADASDINDISSYDFSSEDTTKFLGAFNFVLKQLFTAKKRARILLITHYSDDGISGGALTGKNAWKTVNDLIIEIANYWKIPVCELRNKTGWNYTNGIENLSIFNPDNIHPATDTTGQAVNILAHIIGKEISGLA